MKKLLVRFCAAIALATSTLGIAAISPAHADTTPHSKISAPYGVYVSTGYDGCRGTFDQNIIPAWGGLAWARFKPAAGAHCYSVSLILNFWDTAGQFQKIYGAWSPDDAAWVVGTMGAMRIDNSYMTIRPSPPRPGGELKGDWGLVTARP